MFVLAWPSINCILQVLFIGFVFLVTVSTAHVLRALRCSKVFAWMVCAQVMACSWRSMLAYHLVGYTAQQPATLPRRPRWYLLLTVSVSVCTTPLRLFCSGAVSACFQAKKHSRSLRTTAAQLLEFGGRLTWWHESVPCGPEEDEETVDTFTWKA